MNPYASSLAGNNGSASASVPEPATVSASSSFAFQVATTTESPAQHQLGVYSYHPQPDVENHRIDQDNSKPVESHADARAETATQDASSISNPNKNVSQFAYASSTSGPAAPSYSEQLTSQPGGVSQPVGMSSTVIPGIPQTEYDGGAGMMVGDAGDGSTPCQNPTQSPPGYTHAQTTIYPSQPIPGYTYQQADTFSRQPAPGYTYQQADNHSTQPVPGYTYQQANNHSAQPTQGHGYQQTDNSSNQSTQGHAYQQANNHSTQPAPGYAYQQQADNHPTQPAPGYAYQQQADNHPTQPAPGYAYEQQADNHSTQPAQGYAFQQQADNHPTQPAPGYSYQQADANSMSFPAGQPIQSPTGFPSPTSPDACQQPPGYSHPQSTNYTNQNQTAGYHPFAGAQHNVLNRQNHNGTKPVRQTGSDPTNKQKTPTGLLGELTKNITSAAKASLQRNESSDEFDIKAFAHGTYRPRAGMYRRELVRNRVYWNSIPQREWKFYMENRHPVIGICKHHRKHPLSQVERILILLCIVFLQILWISVFGVAAYRQNNEEGLPNQNREPESFTDRVGRTVLTAFVSTAMGLALDFLAVIDDRCCPKREGGCAKTCIGSFARCLMFTLALGLCIASIVSAVNYVDDTSATWKIVLQTAALSLLQSLTYVWMIVHALKFAWRRWRNKVSDEKLRAEGKPVPNVTMDELKRWEKEDIDLKWVKENMKQKPVKNAFLGVRVIQNPPAKMNSIHPE